MTIIEALHGYARALRVAGSVEAADRAWARFLADMDEDVQAIAGREDNGGVLLAMQHAFDVGYHTGLAEASKLAARALEQAA